MVCMFLETNLPYFDHRKKQETNGFSINYFSCMAVYGAIYDLHVRSTRDLLRHNL